MYTRHVERSGYLPTQPSSSTSSWLHPLPWWRGEGAVIGGTAAPSSWDHCITVRDDKFSTLCIQSQDGLNSNVHSCKLVLLKHDLHRGKHTGCVEGGRREEGGWGVGERGMQDPPQPSSLCSSLDSWGAQSVAPGSNRVHRSEFIGQSS